MSKTCTGCEKNAVQGIPFIVFEKEMTRYERVIKKLWVIIILLIVFLVGSNIVWIVYDKQFETIETTIEAEQNGDGTNVVGGGDIIYGAESQDYNKEKSS